MPLHHIGGCPLVRKTKQVRAGEELLKKCWCSSALSCTSVWKVPAERHPPWSMRLVLSSGRQKCKSILRTTVTEVCWQLRHCSASTNNKRIHLTHSNLLPNFLMFTKHTLGGQFSAKFKFSQKASHLCSSEWPQELAKRSWQELKSCRKLRTVRTLCAFWTVSVPSRLLIWETEKKMALKRWLY